MTEALASGRQINYSFFNLLAHRTKCQPRVHIKKRYHCLGHEHHNEQHKKEKSIAVSAKRLIDEQDVQKRSVSKCRRPLNATSLSRNPRRKY